MFAQRATVLALMLVAVSTWSPVAEADRGRQGGWQYREPDRHAGSYDRSYRSNRSYRNHDHTGAAVGAGLLLGASLLWLAQQPAPPPQRVVVMPPPAYQVVTPPPVIVSPPAPRFAPPPTEVWYYCRSSGAYYPYVPTCATPWEVVPVQ